MTTEFERINFLLEAEAEWRAARDEALAIGAARKPDDDTIESARNLPPYVTNYIGSKQKLVDWIWVHMPDGVKSVLDAFSGSAVVGYMYKTKGLRVVANDRLRYCYSIARAIIENNSVTLTDDKIAALLEPNPKAGEFVQETFRGKFFQSGVHPIIDTIRANIDDLKGFKKDIALFALGKTCISGAGSYGHFGSPSRGSGGSRADTPKEFTERFKGNCRRISGLVFDNGRENKAFNKDVLEVLPEVNADLAYFDPPYATEFSTTNYESAYHFVEGLMTYWKGLEIDQASRVRKFHSDHRTVTEANAEQFFDGFLGKAKGIKYWIISYRDHAYPNEAKMKALIERNGKSSRMTSKDHVYRMAGRNRGGEASQGREHLFVCRPQPTAKADAIKETRHNLAQIDTLWTWDWTVDADAIIEKFGWKGLAEACAYVELDYPAREKEDGRWPQAKAAYHLPYRKLIDGKLQVVWRGLTAAMAALNGARGGVKLPKAARQEAWKTLAHWYKQFEKEPPALAALSAVPAQAGKADGIHRACHTSLTGEIIAADSLSALSGTNGDAAADKRFTFILVHAGSNHNGDHFTVEELRNHYLTAVGTKIDLKHSQDLTDIVGGVVEARFVETDGGCVECDGELFTGDNPHARLAYKLIKKGIVRQVSMECDYEEGECSVCGRRVKSKSDYCLHLKKHKGREYQGKPVYEILHNITFTGMGLLDRKGADPQARILSIADGSAAAQGSLPTKTRDEVMNSIGDFQTYLEARKISEEVWPLTSALEGYISDLLKKFAAEEIGKEDLTGKITSGLDLFRSKMKGLIDRVRAEASTGATAAGEEDMKKLRQENEELRKQVEELQKKVEAYEAEKRKAERTARAGELVAAWERRGRVFKDEAERTAEIERLAGLEDSAFAAAKSVIEALPEAKAEEGDPGKDNGKKILRSDAGVAPAVVDDGPSGLGARLTKGLREVREAQS